MYRFFYNHPATGDVLFLLLEPNRPVTRSVVKGNLTALYDGETLIGVNFFQISKTIKVKVNGMIPVPEKPMLDCINTILANASLPLLSPLASSGYQVMQVVALEEHPVDEKALLVTLSDGSKTYHTVSRDLTLSNGEKVVCALPGCIAYDGALIQKEVERNLPIEVHICSEKELKISEEEKKAFRPSEEAIGSDFFLGE